MSKDAAFRRLCEIPEAMLTSVSEPLVAPQQTNTDNYLLKLFTKKWTKARVSCVLLVTAGIFIAYTYAISASWNTRGPSITVEEYHNRFLKMGSNTTIAKHLRKITQEPHVAGTPENFATADYVLSTFQKYGLDAHYTDYQVLLSYPSSRSLSLRLPGDGKTIDFQLKEKEIDDDPSTKSSKVIPTFHAYSPSGDVSAEVVYANYGRVEDYITLQEMSVDVRGAIVIAKYGLIYRGDIEQNAANAGAIGVVVYSDPEDYGGNRTHGYYPNSRWLPPTGVQRGSLYAEIGDPQTPGWASVSDSERISDDEVKATMPTIPSIPISAEDATVIMTSLLGPVAPAKWQGALNIPSYRLGRGPGVLNLHYKENQTVAPIRNVFGLIRGLEEPDRYVLLGNHRDAWTFGAGDPNGGTAILLELAHRFGKLLRRGWQPRRSIILCNWDAEEYALIGSTEWMEQNYALLFSTAVAYINVDVAVTGPGFFPQSTPQLDDLLQDIAKQVKDPDDPDKTIYESWIASSNASIPAIGRLGGGGSDFAPFLQHAGVPAITLRFGKGFPTYHSLYDDYIWMAKFGDPLFHRHVAVGAIWGLTALKLADAGVLPFNYTTYANNLQSYVEILESQLKVVVAPSYVTTNPLHKSITELRNASLYIMKKAQELEVHEGQIFHLRSLNDHLLMAERAFTDAEGLPQHPWFKHLVYGPSRNNKYGTSPFPGISDSIAKAVGSVINNSTSKDAAKAWSLVQHEIWRVSRAIDRVALVIHGEFT